MSLRTSLLSQTFLLTLYPMCALFDNGQESFLKWHFDVLSQSDLTNLFSLENRLISDFQTTNSSAISGWTLPQCVFTGLICFARKTWPHNRLQPAVAPQLPVAICRMSSFSLHKGAINIHAICSYKKLKF